MAAESTSSLKSTVFDQDLSSHKPSSHQKVMASVQAEQPPLDNSELYDFMVQRGIFPTEHETKIRRTALETLRSVLIQEPTDHRKGQPQGGQAPLRHQVDVPMVLVPIGSYALGVWTTLSEIDCLVCAGISSELFLTIARQRLRKAAHLNVGILRTVTTASSQKIELVVDGVIFNVHYCSCRAILDSWSQISTASSTDPMFDLPITILKTLNMFRDIDYLSCTIPNLASFRLAHRLVRAWAESRGLLSRQFGYLGGFHITLLLVHVCKAASAEPEKVAAPALVRTFFHCFAHFDWAEMIIDPLLSQSKTRYSRSKTEPLVLLSIHKPLINVAYLTSLDTLQTLSHEFKRAESTFSRADMTWSSLIDGVGPRHMPKILDSGPSEFLRSFDSYIRISVRYWGISETYCSRLVSWLESRHVKLLADLGKHSPTVHVRVWPKWFTNVISPSKPQTDQPRDEYEGIYLVGLTKAESGDSDRNVSGDGTTKENEGSGSLSTILRRFETQLRLDEAFFDPSNSWLEIIEVAKSDLGDLKLDDRKLSRPSEEGSDLDALEEELDAPLEASDEDKKGSAQSVKHFTKQSAGTGYLRPASDVLNRVRWDANFDSNDYLVVYDDRFLGTRETPVDMWKSEQTDEDFIPQHRIVGFKRRSDGEVVWNRSMKLDKIFDSGGGKSKE